MQAITNLAGLGWSPFFAEAFAPYAADGLVPGRVTVQHRGAYVVHTEAGELPAEVTGRLRHEAAGAADLPAVGDWVAARPGDPLLIHAVLQNLWITCNELSAKADHLSGNLGSDLREELISC